ncbi:chemotaxis protein CheC [Candidatus Bathyarchaeota archaeon]|nr:chemotaxis protein CheC [Candidatus Bathyarchaeota archaeon]
MSVDVESADVDYLLKVGECGADRAADALSTMLNMPIGINISGVHILPPHKVQGLYDKSGQVTVGLFMDLQEECTDFILALERDEGETFAGLMLGGADAGPELVEDALKEMANIVIGSFMSAMSDATGVKMVPTPPQMMVDFFDSLLEQFLVKQTLLSDTSVVFETTFKRGDEVIDANLIVLGGHRSFGGLLSSQQP